MMDTNIIEDTFEQAVIEKLQGLAKVESFISRFQITEEIGQYEIEMDKIQNTEETKETLQKKILLKRLQLQRIKFEEILKEHSSSDKVDA